MCTSLGPLRRFFDASLNDIITTVAPGRRQRRAGLEAPHAIILFAVVVYNFDSPERRGTQKACSVCTLMSVWLRVSLSKQVCDGIARGWARAAANPVERRLCAPIEIQRGPRWTCRNHGPVCDERRTSTNFCEEPCRDTVSLSIPGLRLR